MAFYSVFDVIGPNMIGPSSSHTAGANVIGYLAHQRGNDPERDLGGRDGQGNGACQNGQGPFHYETERKFRHQ